jgi:hypothetical protein
MKFIIYLAVALAISCASFGAAVAQLSPSVVATEKERLRKANEEAAPKITAGEVAAASAARKTDKAVGYEAGCAAKQAVACFELGNHLRTKNGRTPQDAVDAATAYGLACQLNHPEGCNIYGEIREKGEGLRVPRDPMMALNAYGQSCKLGFSNGCYNAATLLSSGKSPDPALQAKQAQAAKSLYKAGCDLKNYYSCKAIGLAPPEPAPALATVTTAAGSTPEPIIKNAANIIHVNPGAGHKASDENGIRLTKPSVRINAAVDTYTRTMAAQGYEIQGQSYVLRRYDGQLGSRYSVPLYNIRDYAFFAACSEPCTSVELSVNSADFKNNFYPTNKDSAATTRWIELNPKESGVASIGVISKCLTELCPTDSGAGAQLVVYRRKNSKYAGTVPVKGALDIEKSYTGYDRYMGASELVNKSIEAFNENRDNKQIAAAVDSFTNEIAARGYEIDKKSYVLQQYVRHKISLSQSYDYVAFAACSEICTNLRLVGTFPDQLHMLVIKDENIPATKRWGEFSPKESGIFVFGIKPMCSTDPCPKDNAATAQLIIYRRLKTYNIEAVTP